MHVSDFLAAAVQLTSGQDPELNFNAAEEQIDLAARRGAELIGLPENFAFMGEDSRRLELAPTLAAVAGRPRGLSAESDPWSAVDRFGRSRR